MTTEKRKKKVKKILLIFLVIVAVFVPLTMLTGMAGIMFKELGWIVTIVVCVSTTTAITLIPMLASKMLKEKKFFVNKDEEDAYKAKQAKKNTAMIPISRRILAGPVPFAYQQSTAGTGESNVIPYQIIM